MYVAVWPGKKKIRRYYVTAMFCSLQRRWRRRVSLKRRCIYTGLHGDKGRNGILIHRRGNL
jgi:hypothetical protein